MTIDDDVTFPLDGSGRATTGAQDDSTGYAFPVRGDEVVRSIHQTMWRWDSSALEWVRWDGKIDALVSGDLIIAIDDLEQYILDQRLQYMYAGLLEDGTDTYVGYEDKDGNYYIAKYDSVGDPTYTIGTGGIPDKSTPSNWTGLSYGSVADTF